LSLGDFLKGGCGGGGYQERRDDEQVRKTFEYHMIQSPKTGHKLFQKVSHWVASVIRNCRAQSFPPNL
jgi:hypothetical protein